MQHGEVISTNTSGLAEETITVFGNGMENSRKT